MMKLSVIMPVFNEAETLPAILKKIMDLPLNKEIVIVDDHSTDRSSAIIEGYRHLEHIKIIKHPANYGKGRAIRSALQEVTGTITIIQDADLEYDPGDYEKLIEPILKGHVPVVYGARPGTYHSYFRYYLGGRLLSFIVNMLYKQNLTDVSCCYKVFQTDFLKSIPLKCEGFDFDCEITAKIAKRNIRITEIPVSYIPRSFEEGKKIRWTDGAKAIWILVKQRFSN
jgi:dolichol-phosphate mannosyltransferase